MVKISIIKKFKALFLAGIWLTSILPLASAQTVYDFEVVARTGESIGGLGPIEGLSLGPSINDSGKVAFFAVDIPGPNVKVFVENEAGNLEKNFTIFPTQIIDNNLEINNSDQVIFHFRDNRPGSILNETFIIRIDSETEAESNPTIGTGSNFFSGPFSRVHPGASLNNNGGVVFSGVLKSGGLAFAFEDDSFGPGPDEQSPPFVASTDLFPMISDDERTIVLQQDISGSKLLLYPDRTFASAVQLDTGGNPPQPEFQRIGNKPGISDDGRIVAFFGEHQTLGTGIFVAAINQSLQVQKFKLTDIPSNSNLNVRVGINHSQRGRQNEYKVAYLTNTQSGQLGLFTIEMDVTNPFAPVITSPSLIVEVGSPITGLNLGSVQEINVYDPLNDNGQLVFWTRTTQGQAIVRATVSGTPIASFAISPEEPILRAPVIFDARDSFDPDGQIDSYSWDFGDGTREEGPNEVVVNHVYDTPGTYTVRLTVTDDEGQKTSVTKTIMVGDPPIASFGHAPQDPLPGNPVIFDARDSFDPDGRIDLYRWDFGDGTGTEGPNEVTPNHVFDEAGVYTAELTVIDNDGLSDSFKRTVTVGGPTATFTVNPNIPLVNEPITFDASGSSPVNGEIVSYHWDLGDGTSSDGPIVNHTYTQLGEFSVILTVTDSSNLTGAITEVIKVSSPPEATFSISPEVPEIGKSIIFDASASVDIDGQIVLYQWDLGDGGTSQGPIVSHTYSTPGAKVVTLTITDNDGLQSLSQRTLFNLKINVLEVPFPAYTEKDEVTEEDRIIMRWPYKLKVGIEYEQPPADQFNLTVTINEIPQPIPAIVLDSDPTRHQMETVDLQFKNGELNEVLIPMGLQSNSTEGFYQHSWDWAQAGPDRPPVCSTLWDSILSGALPIAEIWGVVKESGFLVSYTELALKLDEFRLQRKLLVPNARFTYRIKVTDEFGNTVIQNHDLTLRVPRYKKDALNAFWIQSIATSLYSIIGDIIVSKSPLSLVAFANEAIFQVLSCGFWTVAVDPDPNFTKIAIAESISLSSLNQIPNLVSSKLAQDSLQALANLRALQVTLGRYEGAKEASNLEWMFRQLNAAKGFQSSLLDALSLIRKSNEDFINQMESLDVFLTETDVVAFQEKLLNEGLPEIENDVLAELGVSLLERDLFRQVTVLTAEFLPLDWQAALRGAIHFLIEAQEEMGDTIDQQILSISGDVPLTRVPDLTRLDINKVEDAIKNAELEIGNITFEISDEIQLDHVIRQEPVAGTIVNKQSTVNLVISSGPSPFVDLTISNMDKTNLQFNGQELTVSGPILATLSNLGNTDIVTPFTVLFFEDMNGNGSFDARTDRVLGQMEVTAPLPAGQTLNVSTPLSGSVTFSGNLIWGLVDSEDVIVEDNEGNNFANCGETCVEPQIFQAGIQDDFGLPVDQVAPSPELANLMTSFGGVQDFDLIAGMNGGIASRQVAHTFTGLPNDIIAAKLELRIHGGDDPQVFTDGIILSFLDEATANFEDAIVFGRSFGPTNGTGTIFKEPDPGLLKSTNWATGDVRTFTLDLSALPLLNGTTLNLVPQLNDKGFLDVVVSDETGVDFMRLSVTTSSSSTPAPDLTSSFVQVTENNDTLDISARIGNGGATGVAAGVSVAFYDGNPTDKGELLGISTTTTALQPGMFEDVLLTLSKATRTTNTLWVVADDSGGLQGIIPECDELNNLHDSGLQLTGLVQIPVPPVIGLPQEDAEKEIIEAGLEVGTITEGVSSEPVGTVIQQNPAAGIEVDEGSAVNLGISSGPSGESPTISSISPDSGLTLGGTLVTIAGANLGLVTEARIGGQPLVNMMIIDAGTIRGNTQPGSPGLVDVVVNSPSGSSSLPNGFLYQEGTPAQGSALRFDGTNDFVTFGTVSPLAEHTLETWVKPSSTTGGVIFGHISGPGEACGFGTMLWGGGEELFFDVDPAGCGTSNFIGHKSDTIDVWTHVAGTFDGNTARLYINGVLVNEKSGVNFAPSTWMNAGAITFFNGQQQFFSGELDEIRIWTVARSVKEIQDAMHRPLSGTEPSLAGYWKFDEGTGQQVGASSSGGVTGLLGSNANAESSDPEWVVSGAPIRQVAILGDPDLVISDINKSALVFDGQGLGVSGDVTATIENIGAKDIADSFEILFFEDRNNNSLYDPGTDELLGQTTFTTTLQAGQSVTVSTTLSGSVLFSGNLIWGFVDSGNVIAESNENNNLANCGELCVLDGPVPDLVGYYRFEEGEPDLPATEPESILDSAGTLGPGSPNGGPTYRSDVALTTVPQNELSNTLSMSFDGSNEVTFNSIFPLHTPGDATLEFWLKYSPISHQSVFWTRIGSTDANRFNIFVNGNGTFGFDYRSPSGERHALLGFSQGGAPIPTDQWTHIAIVRVGNNYSLYVDNNLVETASDPQPDLPTSTGWTISGRSSPNRFVGKIDEVRIFNRALSHSEFLISPPGGEKGPSAPDLTASFVRVEKNTTTTAVIARIGNGGANVLPAGVQVFFYDGNPATGGTVLGTVSTTMSLQPGQFEDVELVLPSTTRTSNTIWVVADDSGGLSGEVAECNEENNIHDSGLKLGGVESPMACDVDGNSVIDMNDINAIFASRGTPADSPDDPRDENGDGLITVNDGRACVLKCTNPRCAP